MKTTGFCLFEYDTNDETLVTFIFPSVEPDLKTVIGETASYLSTVSNTLSLFSAYKGRFLYFEGKRSTDKTDNVRLYGICLIADNFHPALYSGFARFLCEIFHDTAQPPKVLLAYLATLTDGNFKTKTNEFTIDDYPEDCFAECKFDTLLDRAGQYIPVIWQALVCGKTIAFYSPDVSVMQSCASAILAMCKPGNRNLLPLVLDSSTLQTDAADATNLAIWCSIDAATLSGRYDLIVDLSTRTARFSQAFQKEAGKSNLPETLMSNINEATAADASVAETINQFNKSIVDILQQVKVRSGNLSSASIQALQLPSDTKMLLTDRKSVV